MFIIIYNLDNVIKNKLQNTVAFICRNLLRFIIRTSTLKKATYEISLTNVLLGQQLIVTILIIILILLIQFIELNTEIIKHIKKNRVGIEAKHIIDL